MVSKEEFLKKVAKYFFGIGIWGTFTLLPNQMNMKTKAISKLDSQRQSIADFFETFSESVDASNNTMNSALDLQQLINYFRAKGQDITANFLESFNNEEDWDGYPVSQGGWMDEDFAKRHLFGIELNAEAEKAWREIKANVTTAVFA